MPPAQKIPAALHGVYEGTMMGHFPVVLTVTENEADFFNSRMPKTYTHMTYTEKGNGEWVVDCYNPDKEGDIDVTVTFNMKEDPPTADIYIHPMGAAVYCKKMVKKDPGLNFDINGKILQGWTKDPNGHDLVFLQIPEGTTEIAQNAFKNENGKYNKLNQIQFPVSLEKIGASAFEDCTKLTGELKLPENLETLGQDAFKRTGITTVNIPANVPKIGDSAFSYCTALTTVDFSKSTALLYIGDKAFEGCTKLKQLNLPATLKTIGETSFFECGLEGTLSLPAALKKIDKNAFQKCKKIDQVDLSACTKLTAIATGAFNFCTELTQVTLPASLTTLENCFTGCTKLAQITVDPANKTLCTEHNIVYNKDQTELIFAAPALKKAVAMPTTLTHINRRAFINNQALTEVKFPANLTTIEWDAFYQCEKLVIADLTDCTKLTTIGEDAFGSCPNAKFKLPAGDPGNLKEKLKKAGVKDNQFE